MTRRMRCLVGVAVAVAVLAAPVAAQFAVYDPANYFEAVLQYEQLVQQYQVLVQQARRLPVDMASRYHAHSSDWTTHNLNELLLYARPLLAALNEGDVPGAAYRDVINPLDQPSDGLNRMTPELQRRLATAYSTIEISDSIGRLAINQTGAARVDGPVTLQAIKNVEHDVVDSGDTFHTQTALLDKISAAAAIELRLGAQTNQFMVSSLEQQILENKRKRDAEAELMNATIYQWRYGQMYGEHLFGNTASRLDTWRPY